MGKKMKLGAFVEVKKKQLPGRCTTPAENAAENMLQKPPQCRELIISKGTVLTKNAIENAPRNQPSENLSDSVPMRVQYCDAL